MDIQKKDSLISQFQTILDECEITKNNKSKLINLFINIIDVMTTEASGSAAGIIKSNENDVDFSNNNVGKIPVVTEDGKAWAKINYASDTRFGMIRTEDSDARIRTAGHTLIPVCSLIGDDGYPKYYIKLRNSDIFAVSGDGVTEEEEYKSKVDFLWRWYDAVMTNVKLGSSGDEA